VGVGWEILVTRSGSAGARPNVAFLRDVPTLLLQIPGT
jgi:hypothetical protein